MTQNGATEDTWENSAQGKRSLQDWIDELLKNKDVAANYSQGLADIANSVERQLADVRTKYMNQLIDEFGSYEDRFDKLTIEWTKISPRILCLACKAALYSASASLSAVCAAATSARAATSSSFDVTKSYKTFATQLKSAGTVVTDIGGRASKLARIFSSDIADSMDKALGFIDEVVDALRREPQQARLSP